jgi:hypothetical protein
MMVSSAVAVFLSVAILAATAPTDYTAVADASKESCLATVRDYARSVNSCETAKAYKLLADPLRQLLDESAFREAVTFELAGPSGRDPELKESLGALGTHPRELVLAVEEPESTGRHAIVGIVVAIDVRVMQEAGDLGASAIKDFRDPEWVRAKGLPTWGAQLDTIGVKQEQCTLVENLREVLGPPDEAYVPIAKKWLVATQRPGGGWCVWPPLTASRLQQVNFNLESMTAAVDIVWSAGSPGSDPGPWIYPRPALSKLTYAVETAIDRDPVACSKCGSPLRPGWSYCPSCGAKRK